MTAYDASRPERSERRRVRTRVESGIYMRSGKFEIAVPARHGGKTLFYSGFPTLEAAREARVRCQHANAEGKAHPMFNRDRSGYRRVVETLETLGRSLIREQYEKGEIVERTFEGKRGYFTRYVVPAFGDRTPDSVSWEEVEAWCEGMRQRGLAKATQIKALSTLANIYRKLNARGICDANPCRDHHPRPPENPISRRPIQPRAMTVSEVLRAAGAMEPVYRVILYLALFGGLRNGELRGLCIDSFDAETGLITVKRQGGRRVSRNADGTPYTIERTKTSAGLRTIPIPWALVEYLTWHIATYHGPRPAGEELSTFLTHPIVVGPQGGIVAGNRATRLYQEACAAAGLGENELGFRSTIHHLRKSVGGLLAHRGADPVTRSRWLGHSVSTIATYHAGQGAGVTWEAYTPLVKDAFEEIRTILDREIVMAAGPSLLIDEPWRDDVFSLRQAADRLGVTVDAFTRMAKERGFEITRPELGGYVARDGVSELLDEAREAAE